MKIMAIVGVLFLVGLALADTELYPRGCIYATQGKCIRHCEEGTHSYSPQGGCGYLTLEATCDNPTPEEDRRGKICDYSSCYCDPPTVRDPVSKKCVKIEDCPKKA